MKKNDSRILRKRKRKLQKRLERRQRGERKSPMLTAATVEYEMSERSRAIGCGGIGAVHMLARRTGLDKAIDENVHVLKVHKPYHESDHVLNIAYNTLTGGTCLDAIALHREDEAYLDALGTEMIPAPTTEGDFTRRFKDESVVNLMEAVNGLRPKLWKRDSRGRSAGRALSMQTV